MRKLSRSVAFALRFVVAHFTNKRVMFYATPKDYARVFGLLAALAMLLGGSIGVVHAVRASPLCSLDLFLGLYAIAGGTLLFRRDDVAARTRAAPGSGYASCYFRTLYEPPPPVSLCSRSNKG